MTDDTKLNSANFGIFMVKMFFSKRKKMYYDKNINGLCFDENNGQVEKGKGIVQRAGANQLCTQQLIIIGIALLLLPCHIVATQERRAIHHIWFRSIIRYGTTCKYPQSTAGNRGIRSSSFDRLKK